MAMSETRRSGLLAGQTAIARKVYEATPISEHWSCAQIKDALGRLGNMSTDARTVRGCLRNLVDSGLVKMSGTGADGEVFIREAVRTAGAPKELSAPYGGHRHDPEATKRFNEQNYPQEVAVSEAPKMIARKPSLEQRLRDRAAALIELAEELETLADDLATERKELDAKLAKYDQLRDLLGSLQQ